MRELLAKVSIQVNDHIYLKSPESSDLGKRIISGSIDLIDEIGFEAFTFRKVAERISSTEASIYRYFENKHKLLLYLSAWYWGWMEYRLVFRIANVESPQERLERAICILTEPVKEDSNYNHINEVKLDRIVVSESSKAYLTRDVDDENREGAFAGYNRLVERVSSIILEIKPDYKYPHMLVSTVIEGAHHQRYFQEHLPSLSDVVPGEDSTVEFSKALIFNSICNEKHR